MKVMTIIIWALILGTVGFLCGFFGPIFLNPGANQGPLLGIFFTGPISFLAGLIGGSLASRYKLTKGKNFCFIGLSSILIAVAVLTASLPGPRYVGLIIESDEKYYARFHGKDCNSYKTNQRRLFFAEYERAQGFPPRNLGAFLGLYVLDDIPVAYRSYIKN